MADNLSPTLNNPNEEPTLHYDADYNLDIHTVSKVRMHDDLTQDGLLKKDKEAGMFITIGKPNIQIANNKEEQFIVRVISKLGE